MYKVICLDMFQTLVDVDARLDFIWRRILGSDHTEALQLQYVAATRDAVVNRFHEELSQHREFRSMKAFFLTCFSEIFSVMGVSLDPETATEVYIDEHNNAPMYDDSLEFVERAGKKYRICLVSDADFDMVQSHVEAMPFDDVFISERVKTYKGNPDGRMFKSVLAHCNVRPDQVLHVGDSSSDINGAARAEIDSCWINRHGYDKHFELEPTYEIESLDGLYHILKI